LVRHADSAERTVHLTTINLNVNGGLSLTPERSGTRSPAT
jgi:hypothetical protein